MSTTIDPLLTKEQAWTALNLSETTINRLLKSKRLPHLKIGNSVRIRESALEQFILECEAI